MQEKYFRYQKFAELHRVSVSSLLWQVAGGFFATVSACKMKVPPLVSRKYTLYYLKRLNAGFKTKCRPNACRSAGLQHVSWELVDQSTSWVHLEKLQSKNSLLPSCSICRGKSSKFNDYFDSRVFLSTYTQSETVLALRMESYLYSEFPEDITFR